MLRLCAAGKGKNVPTQSHSDIARLFCGVCIVAPHTIVWPATRPLDALAGPHDPQEKGRRRGRRRQGPRYNRRLINCLVHELLSWNASLYLAGRVYPVTKGDIRGRTHCIQCTLHCIAMLSSILPSFQLPFTLSCGTSRSSAGRPCAVLNRQQRLFKSIDRANEKMAGISVTNQQGEDKFPWLSSRMRVGE